MALFGKRHHAEPDSELGEPELQPPDEWAAKGKLLYGRAEFAAALSAYASAIDKLDTMYTFCAPYERHRDPSPADDTILQGFNNSLGAALSMDSSLDVARQVEKSTGYLRRIADFIDHEDPSEADRYSKAIDDILLTVKLAS